MRSPEQAALAEARRLLDQPSALGTTAAVESSRTIRAAVQRLPDANLALISVPGDFAVAEARKALELGLHVMIFSDNVPLEDEAALKREARERRRFVMGPDCGTAIIAGVPLGFANVVPRGDIGIIGASGTGIQEVSCLIARAGRGISHAIGTGGRDLKAEVGAITTLMAIDALDADDGDEACRADLQAAGRRGRQAGARSRRAKPKALHDLLSRRGRLRAAGERTRRRDAQGGG